MTDLFTGTWALVTGASSGLGVEFARQLAARRTNLVLTARSHAELERLAAELAGRHGISTHVVVEDLGVVGGAARLAAAVDALGIPIEHLVNNAGFGAMTRFTRSSLERQTEMVRLNCETVLVLTWHFLPKMVERGHGGVIQVSSTAGHQPAPFFTTYGATKAFVLSFASALAGELRGSGVRMLAFCPGPVQTGFQKAAGLPVPDLKRGGLRARVSLLNAAEAVRRGLVAYERGRDVCVPGVVNRVMTLAAKHAPRAWIVDAAARSLSRGGDARRPSR